jgi:hypothetical protein
MVVLGCRRPYAWVTMMILEHRGRKRESERAYVMLEAKTTLYTSVASFGGGAFFITLPGFHRQDIHPTAMVIRGRCCSRACLVGVATTPACWARLDRLRRNCCSPDAQRSRFCPGQVTSGAGQRPLHVALPVRPQVDF